MKLSIISSQHFISSTFVSDIYDLMQRIFDLLFIAPHCNVTVTLVQHFSIKNGILYGFSYLYAALISITNLYPTLWLQSTILLMSHILS